jgi:hypothetical protein
LFGTLPLDDKKKKKNPHDDIIHPVKNCGFSGPARLLGFYWLKDLTRKIKLSQNPDFSIKWLDKTKVVGNASKDL